VEKARAARLKILKIMSETLAAPRPELSKHEPRIVTVKINPEKIGALIGPGGKNIKRICDESGCEINIENDGTVQIYSTNPEGLEVAKREIEGMTAEIEVGKVYRGKVVTIKDFGCFVEVFPGKDGLVHISELANFRVKQTEDIVKVGDEIWVKCLGVDEKGRVRLSRRAAMEERDKQEREKRAPEKQASPNRADRSSSPRQEPPKHGAHKQESPKQESPRQESSEQD
jgi:polyribonucleotide nucleotidyltransferase